MEGAELGRAIATVGIVWLASLLLFISAVRGEADSSAPSPAADSASSDERKATSGARRDQILLVSGGVLVLSTILLLGFLASWYSRANPGQQRAASEQLALALDRDSRPADYVDALVRDFLVSAQSGTSRELLDVAFQPLVWIQSGSASAPSRDRWQGRVVWQERSTPQAIRKSRSCVLTIVREPSGIWQLQGTRGCAEAISA